MQSIDNNTQAFLALVRGGLWETEARLSQYNDIDFSQVLKLAGEQSVVGLVSAGLEQVRDEKVPKEVTLQVVGQILQLEQRNLAMNNFIRELVENMRQRDIYTLLIKGQGIAQCYEKPLWRCSGDVDLLLSDSNYYKAKDYLIPLAVSSRVEGDFGLHQELIIEPWVVELHGDIQNGLSRKIDRMLKEVKKNLFYRENVRSWINGNTTIYLPCVDDDVIIVFTHIIKHLFKGGIGLRQICDWCRLLWKFGESIDKKLLEKRISSMSLMTEWRVFAVLAVEYLGMPIEAMPLYDNSAKWKKKADRIMRFVLYVGNFGHNKDYSYQSRYLGVVRKMISFWIQLKDNFTLSHVFPMDSLRFLVSFTILKTKKSLQYVGNRGTGTCSKNNMSQH